MVIRKFAIKKNLDPEIYGFIKNGKLFRRSFKTGRILSRQTMKSSLNGFSIRKACLAETTQEDFLV